MSREEDYWRARAKRLEQVERIDVERIEALEAEVTRLREENARLWVWREQAELMMAQERAARINT